MVLMPIFFAHIDFEVNKLPVDNVISDAMFHSKVIEINGIKTAFGTTTKNIYKLTRLICFLNPDRPRKILERENFSKGNLIESTSLNAKAHIKRMEYSHIEICLKFENPGNYFIILLRNFEVGWFQFFVKIKKANEERCVSKFFKGMSDLEKDLLKSLRHCITIMITKTEEDDIEDGQMNVFDEGFLTHYDIEIENVASIRALLNDGSYEFYLDNEGEIKEKKVFIADPDNEITNFKKNKQENPTKKRKFVEETVY
ncbi:unnamed protein product [Meloidogyne enterolobii]|uniref:Uncharacterized protein n=1 Tax=Meloidogyne enterolobii TaxID=390850 RepID=A0ACB0ZSQ1_MELEN